MVIPAAMIDESAMTDDILEAEPAHTLTLSRRTMLTSDVVLLELSDPSGADLPAWEPGAHIDLDLGGGLVRQYSLCGDSSDRSTWKVAVLLEAEGGGGSAFIHERLHEGDSVRTGGPRNHFEFVPRESVVFIAGGIGITPLIPMMQAATSSGLDWKLYYGGRTRSSMTFADELLATYGTERVSILPQDEVGLLDLATVLGTPSPTTSVYCCGPEPLLKAVETQCGSWPEGALNLERFAPREIDASTPSEAFEVELSMSGITLTVPPDRSLIELVEEEGIPVVASCYEGTCGSCETFVLEGTPDHRDSVLSESEQDANDVMMICVSRAKSARLVLEL